MFKLQAVILGIERLLPDKFGECSAEYVVKREDVPGLDCKGCGQGLNQACLEKLTWVSLHFPLFQALSTGFVKAVHHTLTLPPK